MTSRNVTTYSHLSVECDCAIWWYRCRKVKAVMALDLKLSFSATIFSMRPRSDTVNLHCPMRMSSSVGVRLHSFSVTLAAMWRQLRLMQDRCFGWIWGVNDVRKTQIKNGWSSKNLTLSSTQLQKPLIKMHFKLLFCWKHHKINNKIFCSLHRLVIVQETE